MVAVIGDGANAASMRLDEKLGSRHAGTLCSVGFEFGRSIETVLMQFPIGAGDGAFSDEYAGTAYRGGASPSSSFPSHAAGQRMPT